MLWVLIRGEAILMSTHNIRFYGELTNIILQLSSNTLLIRSSGQVPSSMFFLTCTSEEMHIMVWFMTSHQTLIRSPNWQKTICFLPIRQFYWEITQATDIWITLPFPSASCFQSLRDLSGPSIIYIKPLACHQPNIPLSLEEVIRR